jgi:hypothetical protein
MTTDTPSTEESSTRAGLGGSFDFQGQVSGSAARSERLALATAAEATRAPIMGRFMNYSLEILLRFACRVLFYHEGIREKSLYLRFLEARALLPLASREAPTPIELRLTEKIETVSLPHLPPHRADRAL